MFSKLFSKSKTEKYKPGQVWNYKTRPGEEDSLLMITVVEEHKGQIIVHIALRGLKIPNHLAPDGFTSEATHLPFAKESIDDSVTSLHEENDALPDFKDGYNQWKAAFDEGKAGIFTITVDKAVDVMQQALSPNNNRR